MSLTPVRGALQQSTEKTAKNYLKTFHCFQLIVFRMRAMLVQMSGPLRLLRRFLKKDSQLKAFATQRGFAELVGCSLGLVQAVEQGITPISKRFAHDVERMTGVAGDWLMKTDASLPIPAAEGGNLMLEHIQSRIDASISTNHADADQILDELGPKAVARGLGIIVSDAQIRAAAHKDHLFYSEIMRVVDELDARIGKGAARSNRKAANSKRG